ATSGCRWMCTDGSPRPGGPMSTSVDHHHSLNHPCPFCGAKPGQPCRAQRRRGRELVQPHSRRVRVVHAIPARPPICALCCECGNIRSCKEPRNRRGYFGESPDWYRQVCDLKCSACGTVRTHALLEQNRDYEEMMQRVALGGATPKDWSWDAERLRREYRGGNLPRNPYLNHLYWVDDAREAWQTGRRTVEALCGDTMKLHSNPDEVPSTPISDGYIAPETVRDQEYEDPDTG